ncbi:large ribosomal subunit protein bL21m-like isoform X1 [Nicotiana tabacum]|uniref:Large ribosomal subunit protein bL21m-like isoform X1 n=1 Tax=Nicotiana tabacum TaxID=4097 RepID=A0AC58U454_TOBAC|nr:50S ribosomal protein L21, mitochondrial-like isoform X1 [Nicotiana tomentosiformis]XP_033511178.1 50S ribosomal protein L21, mitochondrial-like isoform X1 [Nicotiana tomentosiformis]
MANRRCVQTLSRHLTYLLSPNPSSLHSLTSISPQTLTPQILKSIVTLTPSPKCPNVTTKISSFHRHFCSNRPINSDDDEEGSEEETDDDHDVEGLESNIEPSREYTPEEKEHEAAEIGYKVIGPLQKSDRVFKPYEPVFAVVQIGSHQFKVSNGDSIFTEKLKFCEVNDKLILNKVLLLGSTTQTIIGRPILPDAAVHAVVEEHALDAKVLIFKKKRRKNYRRTRGHRQELTKLRITDIQGIEKPEVAHPLKTEKKGVKKMPHAVGC